MTPLQLPGIPFLPELLAVVIIVGLPVYLVYRFGGWIKMVIESAAGVEDD